MTSKTQLCLLVKAKQLSCNFIKRNLQKYVLAFAVVEQSLNLNVTAREFCHRLDLNLLLLLHHFDA